MKDLITDTILAVMANPAAARFEVLGSDMGVERSGALIASVLATLGAEIVEHRNGHGKMPDPRVKRDSIVFRNRLASIGGMGCTSSQAIKATITEDDAGEVWITFDLATRAQGSVPERIAA